MKKKKKTGKLLYYRAKHYSAGLGWHETIFIVHDDGAMLKQSCTKCFAEINESDLSDFKKLRKPLILKPLPANLAAQPELFK